MTDSLAVPTATSFRDVDVAALDQRRRELNAALAPRKVSFTHLIGFALVQGRRRPPGDDARLRPSWTARRTGSIPAACSSASRWTSRRRTARAR